MNFLKAQKMNIFGKLLGNIDGAINQAVFSAVNDISSNMADQIRIEIPIREGGLQSTVRIIPAQKAGGTVVGGVTFGNEEYPYGHDVWKGVSEADGVYHEGNMHFPLEKWPQWTAGGGAEPDSNGWFHFHRVRHVIPANPFVERALEKVDKNIKYNLAKAFRIVFKIEARNG